MFYRLEVVDLETNMLRTVKDEAVEGGKEVNEVSAPAQFFFFSFYQLPHSLLEHCARTHPAPSPGYAHMGIPENAVLWPCTAPSMLRARTSLDGIHSIPCRSRSAAYPHRKCSEVREEPYGRIVHLCIPLRYARMSSAHTNFSHCISKEAGMCWHQGRIPASGQSRLEDEVERCEKEPWRRY
jgi:hypothetical protein